MVKTVFFGTPAFALPTLTRLIASPHSPVLVVTQPDRPRDRGRHTTASPVKRTAVAHRIPVLEPERLRDPEFLATLRDVQPDLGIVTAYGKILPEAVLNIPRLGLVNVHASLLPAYRGAAPIQRAIMAGDTETGITLMRVIAELDAGPILATCQRPIAIDETADRVADDLAELGADLLVRMLDPLIAGQLPEAPQDDRAATFAPRLTKAEGLIEWHAPARAIHDRVRALHPWPHAFTYLQSRRYIILRTMVAERDRASTPAPMPGTILQAHHDRLVVAAGEETAVAVLEIQPEGRRAMSARQFLAGHRVEPGWIFQASGPT